MKSLYCFAFFVCSSAIGGVVQPISTAPQLLIPAAGSTPGANGTFFRTDLTLVNFANHNQQIQLRWLPQGSTGTSVVTMTLLAQNGFRDFDFVRDNLNQSGLGAIVISGVTSTGTVDPTAALYATVRIWTEQPGSTGTTSQSLPVIPLDAVSTPGPAALFALGGQTANFRVNVGIVNLDPVNAQIFLISGPSGPPPYPGLMVSVTVPPMSMQQVPFGTSVIEIAVSNETPLAARSNTWVAYSSSVDSTTGDAWSDIAVNGAPFICCGLVK